MDITPLIPEGRQIVQSYKGGRFKISGRYYDGPVIVQPQGVSPWTFDAAAGALTGESFSQLAAGFSEIDVLLVGTGAKRVYTGPALQDALRGKGPVPEVMDTGAACRTYNVLMAEGRRVAACLLPIEEN